MQAMAKQHLAQKAQVERMHQRRQMSRGRGVFRLIRMEAQKEAKEEARKSRAEKSAEMAARKIQVHIRLSPQPAGLGIPNWSHHHHHHPPPPPTPPLPPLSPDPSPFGLHQKRTLLRLLLLAAGYHARRAVAPSVRQGDGQSR